MIDAINEAMFEFAQSLQCAFDKGWRIKDLRYGERRLGVGPTLIFKKDDKEVMCFNPEDVNKLLEEERKTTHVCGLMGFNPMLGDYCEACYQRDKK